MSRSNELTVVIDEIIKKLASNGTPLPISKGKLQLLTTFLSEKRSDLHKLPVDKISKLLTHLRQNVLAGMPKRKAESKPQTSSGGGSKAQFDEATLAFAAADAIALILTTPSMPREIFVEKVIDPVVQLARGQLEQLIYPSFDTCYLLAGAVDDRDIVPKKSKKFQVLKVVDKIAQGLFVKLVTLMTRLVEFFDEEMIDENGMLLEVFKLTTEPFFVELACDIREPALKILNQTFIRYECSPMVWEHLVDTALRLTSSKRECRWFALDAASPLKISMFSSLVFQLLQNSISAVVKNGALSTSVDCAMDRSQQLTEAFLEMFIPRMATKAEERESRHLFDAFVADLVTALFDPSWPVAEVILNRLACYLRSQMTSKSADVNSRLAHLEMFGFLTHRLCQLELELRLKVTAMSDILQSVKDGLEAQGARKEDQEPSTASAQIVDRIMTSRSLQVTLLDNLAGKSGGSANARLYHVALWRQDLKQSADLLGVEVKPPPSEKGGKTPKRRAVESTVTSKLSPEVALMEQTREFLLEEVQATRSTKPQMSQAELCLMSRYLSVSRPSFKTFNWYLDQMLAFTSEATIMLRNRVVRFLRQLAELDPELLGLAKMQRAIQSLLSDKSAAVRETMVDMVGKIVSSKPELLNVVYSVLIKMLQDSSLCVKKRCVKLLKEVAQADPDFPNLAVYCAHVLTRINDDDGTQKVVLETLEQIWFFMPVTAQQLRSRVSTMVQVSSNNPVNFQMFLDAMLGPREGKNDAIKVQPSDSTLEACRRTVQYLLTSLASHEESSSVTRIQLLSTLYHVTKAKPSVTFHHTPALLPYLDTPCETQEDMIVLRYAAQVLELTLPNVSTIDPVLLANAEVACINALTANLHDALMASSCIACLATIVSRLTRNFAPVREFFEQNLAALKHREEPSTEDPDAKRSLTRNVYIVGMILRKFDPEALGYSKQQIGKYIVKECMEMMCWLCMDQKSGLAGIALKAVGHILIRHPHYMMCAEVKNLYRDCLLKVHAQSDTDDASSKAAAVQVLQNIELYVTEEEILNKKGTSNTSKNLKEGEKEDVCRGMSSSMVQIHLREILQSTFSLVVDVRKATASLIHAIVNFGIVNIAKVLPHLVMMCSDPCILISKSSLKVLTAMHAKYPLYLPMKIIDGVIMDYKLHVTINTEDKLVRGYKLRGEDTEAVIGTVYNLIRPNRMVRRTFLLTMLKMFDQHSRTPLPQLLFVADSLAYLPYQVVDEPMFLVYHIEKISTVSGNDVLDEWKELLVNTTESDSSEGDRSEADVKARIVERLPEDISILAGCVARSHSCKLLLALKAFVKTAYSITDSKMAAYVLDDLKPNDRPASRRPRPPFDPDAVVQAIKRGELASQQTGVDKQELVQDIIDFKQMMMQIDPADPDTLETLNNTALTVNKRIQRPPSVASVASVSSAVAEAGSSKKKADQTLDKENGKSEKADAPKKRKASGKTSSAKEETKATRDATRARKNTSKRLF